MHIWPRFVHSYSIAVLLTNQGTGFEYVFSRVGCFFVDNRKPFVILSRDPKFELGIRHSHPWLGVEPNWKIACGLWLGGMHALSPLAIRATSANSRNL